jgi:hypothetical protein
MTYNIAEYLEQALDKVEDAVARYGGPRVPVFADFFPRLGFRIDESFDSAWLRLLAWDQWLPGVRILNRDGTRGAIGEKIGLSLGSIGGPEVARMSMTAVKVVGVQSRSPQEPPGSLIYRITNFRAIPFDALSNRGFLSLNVSDIGKGSFITCQIIADLKTFSQREADFRKRVSDFGKEVENIWGSRPPL